MTKFYIAKTPMADSRVRHTSWVPVDSVTIDAAKEEAEKLHPGADESVWVGRVADPSGSSPGLPEGRNLRCRVRLRPGVRRRYVALPPRFRNR